jgi:putative ABC transport system permease protein
MRTLLQDLRYAVRWLARNPGFTAVAILTIALGIGTVTTIFSIFDAAVLRPLPFRDPDSLMSVSLTHQEGGAAAEEFAWSYPKFESLRRRARSFEALAAYSSLDLNLTGVAEPERLTAEIVSPEYFPVLGIGAALGRTFSSEDGPAGTRGVALISDGLWKRRFGSAASVLGSTIHINKASVTIVGVLPPRFSGLGGDADVWVPMAMAPDFVYPEILTEDGNHWHRVVARRRPGTTAAAADAEMKVIGRRIAEDVPMREGGAIWGAEAAPLDDSRVDPVLRRSVLVLFGAVTFVLLIACANVAALLLARAGSRRREIAIRLAIGAGRRRIVRQMLTESLILAAAGGAIGVLLSLWGVEALSRLQNLSGIGDPSFLFRFAAVRLDPRVLLFALASSLATGLLFGMAPALHASRSDLAGALKEGGSGTVAGGRRRLSTRALLVPAQIALALVLLVGAGLLIRSLERLSSFQGGFRPEGVLTMRFDPSGVLDGNRSRAIVFRRTLLERLAALPGVVSVANGRTPPVSSRNMVAVVRQVDEKQFDAEGHFPGEESALAIGLHDVSPDYFRTLSIPIRRGRAFTPEDREGSAKVAVVSETTARRLWPGQDPIGHRIAATSSFFGDGQTAQIVGVAGDVLYGRPGERQALDLYYPSLQGGLPWTTLFIKTAGDPAALIGPVRREIHAVSPNLPVFDVVTMEQRAARTFARERFGAELLGLLAAIAVFLAAVGIYGLVAESVSAQTREIGVRMALGARPGDILRGVLRRGLTLAGAGVLAGLAAAFALSRLLSSLLFGIASSDASTYGAVSLALFLVAAAACWLPARRATRIDPTVALRSDS